MADRDRPAAYAAVRENWPTLQAWAEGEDVSGPDLLADARGLVAFLGGAPSADGQRLQVARLVATSWRDAAVRWGSLQMDGRVTAHPLALVLGALDGETDPIELGISPTDPAWNAIKEVARDAG